MQAMRCLSWEKVSGWSIVILRFEPAQPAASAAEILGELRQVLAHDGCGCDVVVHFMGDSALTDGRLDAVLPELLATVQSGTARVSFRTKFGDEASVAYLERLGVWTAAKGGKLHSEVWCNLDEIVHAGGLGSGAKRAS